MNKSVWQKQKQGMAIALKQFPFLTKESGIYLWYRYDENDTYCWYVGKAKNLLQRTAQHIVNHDSHLDNSIHKHGFFDGEKNKNGWVLQIMGYYRETKLDFFEQHWIGFCQSRHPDGRMYNVESGGTMGKTIIGERKQRKDQKWRTEARTKAFDDIRKWFELQAKEQAIKPNGELYAEAKKIFEEFYYKSIDKE